MGSRPCVIHCGGVCIYSIFPALFLLFLGVLILSTSYTNVCSAPCKQKWQHSSLKHHQLLFMLLVYCTFSFCSALILPVRFSSGTSGVECALSFYSPGNSIRVFKVAVCALSGVFCLFPVQYNVIHQYTSTRPHPVQAYLNVNIV